MKFAFHRFRYSYIYVRHYNYITKPNKNQVKEGKLWKNI